MKTTAARPIPYTIINDHTIKINGYSIKKAADNIHEPGWDICFHITINQNDHYFIIDDTLYTYTWHQDNHNHAIYIITPQPHNPHIINNLKQFISQAHT